MNRWTRRLAVAGVSLGLSVLLAELAVRAALPQDLSGSYRVATPSGLLINKSCGTARHEKGERLVHYSFSPPHLRDTALIEGRKTILCLGDSFTFGWLLAAEDTYIAHLQRQADLGFGEQFNFVNAAAAGWGTAECVAFVEELGEEIHPDILLMFLNFNDIGRSAQRRLYTLDSDTGHELSRHPVKVSATKRLLNALPGYEWLLEHSHLAQLCRGAIHTPQRAARVPDAVVVPVDVQQDCLRLGQALFLRLKEWADAHDARLLVTTTGWYTPKEDAEGFEPTSAFLAQADAFFEQHGIPFHDISPQLRDTLGDTPEQYVIAGDGHPNEGGAALIGDAVYRQFLRDQLELESRRE